MAFEYVLDAPGMVTADLPEVRRLFNNELQAYAIHNQVVAFREAGPALRVTDAAAQRTAPLRYCLFDE